ncbi:hypothetical protein LQ247_20040 [Bacillus sp. BS3(2021)]|uniref:hypothetical protein n=1 Tax=Bacillus TaxID=1386 RepID=UPI001E2EE959|nr:MULTISPECIES: hypothetical protein [Bacillus]MCD2370906.1 hypothetical protein [Bacillus sp. BS3(2021)]MCJ8232299.1 hypothetical protein [Bacillus paralicheniformis]
MNVTITMIDDEIRKILRDHFAQKGFNVKGSQIYSDDNGIVRFDIQLYAYDIFAKEDE